MSFISDDLACRIFELPVEHTLALFEANAEDLVRAIRESDIDCANVNLAVNALANAIYRVRMIELLTALSPHQLEYILERIQIGSEANRGADTIPDTMSNIVLWLEERGRPNVQLDNLFAELVKFSEAPCTVVN